MIGEIRKIRTPFYNVKTRQVDMKSRPGLIIAQADDTDYVVLPVSRVTDSRRIDAVYDIKVDPAVYPALSLTSISYVRTHKQTVIHVAEIGDKISDMRSCCEDLYLQVLSMRAQFSEEITKQSIE